MTQERVYVLVAVDKNAVLDSLAASTTVKACLRDVWFEDTFAVADVTQWVKESVVNSRTGEVKRYLNSPFLDELDDV